MRQFKEDIKTEDEKPDDDHHGANKATSRVSAHSVLSSSDSLPERRNIEQELQSFPQGDLATQAAKDSIALEEQKKILGIDIGSEGRFGNDFVFKEVIGESETAIVTRCCNT